MSKVEFKGNITKENQLVSQPEPEDSDKELDNISDDDDHISQRVPDSGVKIFNQMGGKTLVTEEADPAPKNPTTVTKATRNQNSSSPGTRISPPKTNVNVNLTEENDSTNLGKPANLKPKPKKLNIKDPEELKKLIYSKSPKQAAEEYLKAIVKLKEQAARESQQRSTVLTNKNEKTLPYGLNTGGSPDKKEKNEDAKVEYDSAYTELSKKLYMQRLHPQPGTRNTDLTNPQKYEHLLSAKAAKEIENRKTVASKELQDTIVARLHNHAETLNEHNKALFEEYLEKEYEECTFNPRINTQGSEARRSKEQFLDDQKKFLQLIELKRQKVKEKVAAEQKLSEGTYKPELCKKSLKILAKKKKLTPATDEDVHSRLYKLNKNAQQRQMMDIAQNDDSGLGDSNNSSQFLGNLSKTTQRHLEEIEKNATFKPNIQKKSKEIKREIKIEAILYSDAMRRQRKSIEFTKKLNRKQPSNYNISEGSRKALATRFIREFEVLITDILGEQSEQKLDYIQLNEFLKRLSFLTDTDDVEQPHLIPDRILLHDMWYTLYADKYKGVHRRNLLVFLMGVLGLHFEITKIQKPEPKPEGEANNKDSEGKKTSEREIVGPPEEEGVPQRERRIIGQFDDEENLELTPEDVEKIYKVYNVWFLNRIGSKDKLAQIAASKKQEEPNFQPAINENSKNMAHLYRERILEGTSELIQQNKIPAPKDGKLTHADLLVLSKQVVKEKVEKFKVSLEGSTLRDCTFRPITNDYSKVQKSRESQADEEEEEGTRKGKGQERSLELYALRKNARDKKDKHPVEIEYEKNCDECTFQPDTKLTKVKKFDSGATTIMAKNIEKTIQRLRYANELREQKHLMNKRGVYPQHNEPGLSFALEKDSKFKQGSERSSYQGNMIKNTGSMGQSQWDKQGSKYEAQRNLFDTNDNLSDPDNRIEHRYVDDEGHDMGNNHGDEMYIANAYNDDGAEEHHEGEDTERVPLLFVDVNLGQGKSERITVFEGDKSEVLAREFAEEHGLDDVMTGKLKELLDSQIAGLLTRIDEELNSLQSDTDKLDQQGNVEVHRQENQIEEEEEGHLDEDEEEEEEEYQAQGDEEEEGHDQGQDDGEDENEDS